MQETKTHIKRIAAKYLFNVDEEKTDLESKRKNISKMISPGWHRKRIVSNEKVIPPWEYPDAQPPPPPCYSGLSPLPRKKVVRRADSSQSFEKFQPNSQNVNFDQSREINHQKNQFFNQTSDVQNDQKHTIYKELHQEEQDKIYNGFLSFSESSPLTNQNIPQENVSANQLCDMPKSVKSAPLINQNVPLHFVGQIGQSAKNETVTSVPLFGGQSYSEAVTSEQSHESSVFSSMMVATKSEANPQDGTAQKKVLNQSPTPWRKAKTSPETVAKVDASASPPHWRKDKDSFSLHSESKTVTASDMISTTSHSAHFKQNQAQSSLVQSQQGSSSQQQHQQQQQHIQSKQHHQQQQSTQPQNVPWRSPQLKRKEITISSPASTTTTSSSQTSQSVSSSTQVVKISTDKNTTENVTSAQDVKITQSKIITQPANIPQPTNIPPPETIQKPTTTPQDTITPQPAAISHCDKVIVESSFEIKKDSSSDSQSIPPPPVPPHQGQVSKFSPQTTLKESPKLPRKQPTSDPLVPVTSTTTLTMDSSISSVDTSVNVVSENVTLVSTSDIKVDLKSDESSLPANKETESIATGTNLSENIVEIEEPKHNVPVPPIPPPPPIIANSTKTTVVPESEQTNIPPPPPPRFVKEGLQKDFTFVPSSQAPDTLPLKRSGVATQEEEKNSPEYTKESVTSRIKKFEKQASTDVEKPEREIPPAKPVAPWVKKTSSGPVSQEGWDYHSVEGIRSDLFSRETFADTSSRVSKQSQRQIPSDANVSSVTMVLSQPSKEQQIPIPPVTSIARPQQEYSAQQHKQIQRLLTRPRTKSSGDFVHTYIEHDTPNMPAEGLSSAPLVQPVSISIEKGDDKLFDPWCDPKNPKVIQFQDVSAAAFKIKAGILNTPCTRSNMSSLVDMDVFFKKEFNQYTGSFKERGARYTLLCLTNDQKAKGVIAASAGNHALALSYHGQDLGIPVTVVMPLVAPIMKVQACRQYGANILVKGNDIGECREIALTLAQEQGLLYINGYDHPHILAGQGTMGLEIVEQVPNIDAVVVPVGGGGLIAGVALAVKSLYPHVKVIGVESEKCASFSAALKANEPVYVKAESTLADGLAVPKVGVNAFATASKLVDKVVTVREEWIAIAILRLVEMEKAVVEGAGAAALAALLAGELPELKGKRVVIPLCGGNIDTTVLGRCLERGLAADGRLVKFTVTVSDRPGGIADLTRMLANLGVSIKDMLHERAWIRSDIFSVEVKVLCETRDYEHSEELREALLQRYKILRFGNERLQYSIL